MSTSSDIAVVGLGYVGLPLALAFAKAGKTVAGFDVNKEKIEELKRGVDRTNEVEDLQDLAHPNMSYSADPAVIKQSQFVIVAVPTPITAAKQPDLSMVESASRLVGKHLQKGAIVVFESTVYPGVTEDICVPLIDEESGLKCGKDWFVGYSPERINPGDREHTLERIIKVAAGMTPAITDKIAEVYEVACKAGVHKAESIKVAEAAKVIENIQRDLNIALTNELAIIFGKMGIRTSDVMRAAGTKWNFHKYTPGLVGGHCIGVDPYYLMFRALELGVNAEVITAGRRINDSMPEYVAGRILEAMAENGKNIQKSKALILGVTFKENVPDIRNSKVFDLMAALEKHGLHCEAYDPVADKEEVAEEYGFHNLIAKPHGPYDVVVLASPHAEFVAWQKSDWEALLTKDGVMMDIKSAISPELVTGPTYLAL
jgi:UDP-N-acetyl-D-galactosamine dehydrogenase